MTTFYLILINLIGFLSMGLDKSKARRGKWRIKERTLFLIALVGGSTGSLCGMYFFRHKTKHRSFVIGIPAILILQAAGFVSYYFIF
ncbi:MAG: DUF1294 domain-containing protein [Clostridiales bacterium]|nr:MULTISPECIES: DUF1294 domain-containing protein [Robinsoniella]MDU7026663.1 DUF1294 domain-containing protein [Clostridiales bacterium]